MWVYQFIFIRTLWACWIWYLSLRKQVRQTFSHYFFAYTFCHFSLLPLWPPSRVPCSIWWCPQRPSEWVCTQWLRWYPILCDPMEHGPPRASLHGVLQARILEWVAMSPSRGSFQPRDCTRISCIAGGFSATEPLGKPHKSLYSFFLCYYSHFSFCCSDLMHSISLSSC